MSENFSAYDDLIETLDEVSFLLDFAKDASLASRSSTFIKMSILLLAGKFEAFIEGLIQEFQDEFNSIELKGNDVPRYFKIPKSIDLLNKILSSISHEHKISDSRVCIASLFSLWHDFNESVQIEIPSKMKYGKHGEKEIIRLFEPLGFKNIFDETLLVFPIEEDSSFTIDTQSERNFKHDFNSLVNLRNNILHQNAEPQKTTNDVETYIKNIKLFSFNLNNKLKNILADMRKTDDLISA